MIRGTFTTTLAAGLCVGFCCALPHLWFSSRAAADPSPVPSPTAEVKSPPGKTETPAVLVDDTHLESILGKEVRSASGDVLGNITDVLVEGDGRVRAAVIDLGGFLGVGVRKIAVAWIALRFVQQKSGLTADLDMTKDQLRVAPEYRTGEPIVIVGAKPISEPSPPSADR